MIYWITGKAKSGKTTLAKSFAEELKKKGHQVLVLDGDDVREQFKKHAYTDEARRNHILHVADIAAIAERQGIIVIVAMISPKKSWRMEAMKKFCEYTIVYLSGGYLWVGTEYEIPDEEETI